MGRRTSGHRYGTLRSEIDRIRDAGRVPLLELETRARARSASEVEGAVNVFVDAPTFDELERAAPRAGDGERGEIGERLELAREQQRAGATSSTTWS